MAAGDFSASVANDIQAWVEENFQVPNSPVDAEFRHPVQSVKALLENQTARPSEILDRSGRCIAYNVYWLKSGVDSVIYDGDGTTPALSLDCDIDAGTQFESDTAQYTDNVRVISVMEVDDDKCANLSDFVRESALAVRKAMVDIRKKLNIRAINFVNANAQDNNDSEVASIDLGNGAWAVNADGKTIEVPIADLSSPDSLASISTVLDNNELGEYFLLSGRFNWYNAMWNSMFDRLNDNERDRFAKFAEFSMYWDTRDLDATLTGRNSFAVNPHSYVLINRSFSEPEPRLVSSSKDLYEYFIEDPELMVMDSSGVMRPVRYEVRYQKICDGVDANTRSTTIHRWEVKFLGTFAAAPVGILGSNDLTGIMKIAGV
jgi:hypothetical protein